MPCLWQLLNILGGDGDVVADAPRRHAAGVVPGTGLYERGRSREPAINKGGPSNRTRKQYFNFKRQKP
jgi:hypothetical protein